MLALRIEYLTGRATATCFNNRDRTEWPPHPARLFSALVATWADADPPMEGERAALQWLEALPPPEIAAAQADARLPVTHFVPVNDPSLLSAALGRYADNHEAALVKTRAAAAEAATPTAESGDSGSARKPNAGAARSLKSADAEVAKSLAKYRKELSTVIAEGPATPTALKEARRLIPETRTRQPRSFPSSALRDPVVHFVWPDAPADADGHHAALVALVSRLVALGHSSSMVHARWVDAAPPALWVPTAEGSHILRTTEAGQLARLIEAHALHRGVEPRVLPYRAQRYALVSANDTPEIGVSVFSGADWIVLRRAGGDPVRIEHCAAVARAVRKALMRHADHPITEMLSGHQPDGTPTRSPHLALVPLPHVGHRHADGRLMGLALIFPRSAGRNDQWPVLRALGHWEQAARVELGAPDDDAPTLTIGWNEGLRFEVERIVWGEPGAAALRPETWCAPSREWLSVTPVALDRHPGDLWSRTPQTSKAAEDEARASIALACERIGLSRPIAIDVLKAGPWAGVVAANRFPVFAPGSGRTRKVLVHARLRFAAPVAGPILLGAGRFHGLGLFKPSGGAQ